MQSINFFKLQELLHDKTHYEVLSIINTGIQLMARLHKGTEPPSLIGGSICKKTTDSSVNEMDVQEWPTIDRSKPGYAVPMEGKIVRLAVSRLECEYN